MHYDWVNLVDSIVAGGVAVSGFIGALKKWPWLMKGANFIVNHAPDVVKTVEAIAESPAGAIAKEALHHEIDKVSAQFQKSEIGRLALVGLHSFNTDLANLSDVQKTALIHVIKTNVPNVTDDQIKLELDAMQLAAQSFGQLEIVKAANIFTQAARGQNMDTATVGVNTNA